MKLLTVVLVISEFFISLSFILTLPTVTSGKSMKAAKNSVPTIDQFDQHFMPPIGHEIALRCKARGKPAPNITWLWNGHVLDNSTLPDYVTITNGGIWLKIIPKSFADSGVYACLARNSQGSAWLNFTVQVIEPEIEFVYSLPEEDVINDSVLVDGVMKEGRPLWTQKKDADRHVIRLPSNPLDLKCPAVGNPEPDITWLKNGQPINARPSGHIIMRKFSLKIDSVIMSDQGNYTCVVSNKFGELRWTYEVEVRAALPHPPLIHKPEDTEYLTVSEGDTAEFDCRHTSDPVPFLKWLRNYVINDSRHLDVATIPYQHYIYRKTINTTDNDILYVRNVTSSDAGWYTCLVGNSIGLSHHNTLLTVEQPVAEPVVTADGSWGLDLQRGWGLAILVGASSLSLCALVAGLLYVVCCCCRKRAADPKRVVIMRNNTLYSTSSDMSDHQGYGEGALANTPLIPVVKLEVGKAQANSRQAGKYKLPVDSFWEFPREQLVMGRVLGEGAFGLVLQAEAMDMRGMPNRATVAVKMLKDDASDHDLVDLVQEMEVMKVIGQHINIINLLGCCTQGGPLLVIVEFAPHGNLRDFLRARRPSHAFYDNPPPSDPSLRSHVNHRRRDIHGHALSYKDLVSYSYQVTSSVYKSETSCTLGAK